MEESKYSPYFLAHLCAVLDRSRRETPTIDPASFTDPVLAGLYEKFIHKGLRVWLKDFSQDFPVPTVGALVMDPATFPAASEIVFTAGTASSPQKAAIRALTEIAQLGGDFETGSNYETIAMGLIERVEEDGSSKMAILSDIQGLEDFLGDMDFKVAGTKEGITAIQMDIKVHGLSKEVLSQALEQAREGRLHIMGEMLDEIDAPRAELSKYAPRIITMKIDPEQVRVVIGPGGKTINKITQETGAKLDLEDDGTVFITAPDMESAHACQQAVELLTKDVEVGEVYEGEIKRIMASSKIGRASCRERV